MIQIKIMGHKGHRISNKRKTKSMLTQKNGE